MVKLYQKRKAFLQLGLATVVLCLMSSGAKAQTLVWEENFNSSNINTNVWVPEVGDGCDKGICGWGNNELQYYTNRTENARIEDGNLVIEARREAMGNKAFTSARLKTEGKFQFKYGTIEARIKMPKLANGLWPAFWTLGTVGGGWPRIGEIDMVEMGHSSFLASGMPNRKLGAATHWENNNGQGDYVTDYTSPADLTDDYHIYKMVWTRQAIKIYVDDHEFFTFDISGAASSDLEEFHNQHFLLLNLAVGGNYPGIPTPAGVTAPLPGKMYIDYIKLYQNAGDELYAVAPLGVEEDKQLASGITLFPNPNAGELKIQSAKKLDGAYVRVFDQQGKEVYNGVLKGNRIKLGNLKAGAYSLVLNKVGQLVYKRFIRE